MTHQHMEEFMDTSFNSQLISACFKCYGTIVNISCDRSEKIISTLIF